jgi:hypothetical protein
MASALPLTVKTTGRLLFVELLHEVAGAAAEGGERLEVFGEVEHWDTYSLFERMVPRT